MKDLFEAIRGAATPQMWSRGVELARADAVYGEAEEDREITLRIAAPGGLHSFAVTLLLDDEGWECTCSGTDDPCEHVTGAVIALRQARAAGKPLPTAAASKGQLGYRFTRSNGALAFERVVVTGNRSTPLTTTLAAVASGRVDGPSFLAKPADLEIERVLGTRLRGVLPREILSPLFTALERLDGVTLDGEPIEISGRPVVPEGRLVDQNDGFRLYVELDPAIAEKFTNGVLRVGKALRPVGQSKLTARELEELPKGVYFPPDEVGRLVTEVLPSLADRIPFEIRTRRLPKTMAEPPRLVLDTRMEGDELVVLPTLVYGDPPSARVDSGRIVLLGEGAVPLRDLRAEARLVRMLQAQLDMSPGREERTTGQAAIVLSSRLDRFDAEVRGSGTATFFRAEPLVAHVETDGGRFDLRFESAGEHASGSRYRGTADAGAVLRAWRTGAALVPISTGGWAPLPSDFLAKYGEAVTDLLAAREPGGRVPPAMLPDLARLCAELERPPPPGFEKLRALADATDGGALPALPTDLAASLREYQRTGVHWLSRCREADLGALLADDMGLGKTLQALCAVQGRTLVVAPTSVVANWQAEARRFRPTLEVAVYHGPKRALDPRADLTITTWALLRLDVDALSSVSWDTIVLDEAQAMKNPESQVAQAAFRLDGRFRMTLSGTPVENRLDELWSQMHFLNRGLLGGRKDFDDRYAQPIANGNASVAARLRQRIRPFLMRRLKRDVAPELPPRTEVVLRCELSIEERAAYDTIRAATRAEVVEKLAAGGSVLAALEALLRLRQACCHTGLLPGRSADTSAKIELLMEELETVTAEGHRALVFSQWTSLLDLVEPHLERASIRFTRLDGSTADRAGVVAEFQDDAGPPVMLVSLKAGGTGLNLTAADHVFLLDPWWNPAVEDQAADRAHRIGQTRPVLVQRLVAENTVEEKMLALQESKRATAEIVLGDGGTTGTLTREDLLALLSD